MSIFFAAPIDQHPDYDKVTTVPTCAQAEASYPASNLLTYDPTQVMRANPSSGVITIQWDLGSAKTFDIISLIHTNLTDAALWVMTVSNDGVNWVEFQAAALALAHCITGQTVQNKKNMLRRNLTLHNHSSPVTFRYISIQIYGDVSPGTSIGRLFVGKKFVPSTGWQYGSQFGFQDISRRERTDRGALVLDPLPPIITADVKLSFLNKTEMYDFVWEFNYWRGSGREFFACLDVEDTKYLQKNTMYCTISEGRQISFDSYNTHSSNWVLENIAAA